MNVEKLSDMALVARAAALGDKRAFSILVSRHQESVRRFFMHQTLGDKELSDDLAQDTFIKAWTALSRFHGVASFSTWIYRIACNVLYDHVRRRRPTAGMDTPEARHTAARNRQPTLKMDIYNGLARLADNERLCITLQLVEGRPINEITKITGLPEGTVKSHLKRGKEKLAKYLKDNGYE